MISSASTSNSRSTTTVPIVSAFGVDARLCSAITRAASPARAGRMLLKK